MCLRDSCVRLTGTQESEEGRPDRKVKRSHPHEHLLDVTYILSPTSIESQARGCRRDGIHTHVMPLNAMVFVFRLCLKLDEECAKCVIRSKAGRP